MIDVLLASVLSALGLVFLLLLRQLRSLGRHLAPLHAQPRPATGGRRAALLVGTAVAAALAVLPALDHDSSGDTRDRGHPAPTAAGPDRSGRPPAPGETPHRTGQGRPEAPGGIDSLDASDGPASSPTGPTGDPSGRSATPGSTPAHPGPNTPGSGGTGTPGGGTGGSPGQSPTSPASPTRPTSPPGTSAPPATTPPPDKGFCLDLGLPILDLGICLPS
ncbi:hypothetical protein ACIQNU_26875 [Streptomyces sp. NPDC091292]|uniref:hypothetical protein n=1 Tax=Streptomyces sp. NPDC091292 TaxID=3365991 RepID=UPI0038197711